MSDFRAIGGVSASLQALLIDRMELPVGVSAPPLVTVSTPRPETPEGPVVEPPRVNLFLYRVAESPFLRNQEIPGRGHPAAYGHPPLALTLYYLVTAYGSTGTPLDDVADETPAQMLLGSAMRVLHDLPVITDQLITQRAPTGRPILHESLHGEFEQVKLVLDPLSLEDITKVWTALTQRFRLSAAYAVSVVQIESRRVRAFPRPVGEPPEAGPRVHVVTLRQMQITDVRVRRAGETSERTTPHARIGDTLILLGHGFAGGGTRVVLDRLEVPPDTLATHRLEVAIPDDTLPDGSAIPEEERLQPGPRPVAAVATIEDLDRLGFRSNHAVFMLVPRLDALSVDGAATPRMLEVQGARLYDDALTGETIVGRAVLDRATYQTPDSTQIRVPLPDSLPGREVSVLVSGPLAEPLALPPTPEITINVAGAGSREISLPEATTRVEIAVAIERGLRAAAAGSAAYRDFRTGVADDRLVLVAGGLTPAVSASASATATALQLLPPEAGIISAYLSGELRPFPAVSEAQPQIRITLGGVTHDATLADRPTTLLNAASLLQEAIRAAGPEPAFTDAVVTPLGGQLLILPGAAGATNVEPVPDADEASAAELQLRAAYLVRVRVNGAESIGDHTVELPT
jgi:hypothetical protein